MSYRERLPHPALRYLVKCYWHLEEADAGTQTVLPDGCMELIFHFGTLPLMTGNPTDNGMARRAFVGGQITQAIRLDASAPIGMIGVRLWPWSGAPLLGVAMDEIAHRSVVLADLTGQLGNRVPGRLRAAASPQARFGIVDQFMLELGRRAGAVNALAAAAIQRLDRAHGTLPVASLAAGLSISERHLNRILKHHVGLSAKSYGRIRRLQHCISGIRGGEVTTLTDAAHRAGYADQAHFSHDLKKLCGVSPGTLLNEQRLLVEPTGRAGPIFTMPQPAAPVS